MPPKKEDKKSDKKPEKSEGWNLSGVEGAIFLILILAIISTFIPALIRYISSGNLSFYGLRFSGPINFFKAHIQFFKTIGFMLAGTLAIGTFIFNKRADAIWKEEKAKLYPENMPKVSSKVEPEQNPLQEKWKDIITKSEGENPSEWRLCIIEADIILDDLLDTLHLPGDTMGDKLKAVEKSDFLTIDSAWEAHKARNMVAHQGDFLLTQRETRRIVSLYETVFKEFFLI